MINYPAIPGTSPITPIEQSKALPSDLFSSYPSPPTPCSKSIFAFWHSGLQNLPPYLLRNVTNWHTRFSPLGWTIFVLDTVPDSPLNVSNFIDTSDPAAVPEAFTNGTLDGTYAAQHTSDLIRYPILLKYGGIYLDVGVLQFGDLEWMWSEQIANANSPCDFFGFTMGSPPDGISIVNFGFMCNAHNPLVQRAHHILLKVWEGKTNTTGASSHPLVSHVPLMHVPQEVVIDDEGSGKMVINDAAMTDYAVQIQCMGAAQRWVDKADGWDGPKYTREKCWLYSMMDGAFVIEQMTGWSGPRQFELLCQKLPGEGDEESEVQKLARSIVESVVAGSWCLKLGHGFSAKLFGADTLGMLWRKELGSDCLEGTYAGWLRWAEVNVKQKKLLGRMGVPVYEATRKEDFL